MGFDVDNLASSIDAGDSSAKDRAFNLFRPRLKKMIVAFLDPRLKARIDPSDVVQEALIKATVKLPKYLEERPIGFYPWLRAIVRQELINVHRQHVIAQSRSVNREHQPQLFADASAMQLVDRLVGSQTSPSVRASDREAQAKMRSAINELSSEDREILMMRFIEELPLNEIAEVLMITDGAAKSRVRRALERLGKHLT